MTNNDGAAVLEGFIRRAGCRMNAAFRHQVPVRQ
jgi:hypothetical protein